MTKTAPNPVLGELIDDYMDSTEFRALAVPTQRAYVIYLRRLAPLRGARVHSLSRGDIYKLWDRYSATPGAQATLIKVTRRMFGWGIEREKITTAPILKQTRRDRSARRKGTPAWSDDDIARFRREAREYAEYNAEYAYVQDAIEIALATGQRISDVCNAMQMKGWDGEYYEFVQTKTANTVRFKPSGQFLDILRRGAAEKRRYVLNMPPPFHGRVPRLRYHFNVVRERAQVQSSFHGLRKTVAVKLREAGASDAQVAALLGHTDTRMVATYAADARKTELATAAADLMSALTFQGEPNAD